MHLILLPGLDGTGLLFTPFLATLPPHWTATVIAYPPDRLLTYEELGEYVITQLPTTEPYILLAESFSGPLAIRLASQNSPNLQALILCATFTAAPLPTWGRTVARLLCPLLFRWQPLPLAVRYFLLGFDASDGLLNQFYAALRLVAPNVLARRVQMVLTVDEQARFARLTMPILFLVARQDRLLTGKYALGGLARPTNVQVEFVDSPHLMLQTRPQEALRKLCLWFDLIGESRS